MQIIDLQNDAWTLIFYVWEICEIYISDLFGGYAPGPPMIRRFVSLAFWFFIAGKFFPRRIKKQKRCSIRHIKASTEQVFSAWKHCETLSKSDFLWSLQKQKEKKNTFFYCQQEILSDQNLQFPSLNMIRQNLHIRWFLISCFYVLACFLDASQNR